MDRPLSTLFALFWIIIGNSASDRPSRSSSSVVGDDEELVEGSGEREHTTAFGTDATPTEKLILDGYRDYVNMEDQYASLTNHAFPELLIIVSLSVLVSTYLLIVMVVLLCKAKRIKSSTEPSPEASPGTLDSKI